MAKFDVAPFAGAWIEILITPDPIRAMMVAPFAGAWIEIVAGYAGRRKRPCRSLRGSVD